MTLYIADGYLCAFSPDNFAVSRVANIGFEHEFLRAKYNIGGGNQSAGIGNVQYMTTHAAIAPLKDNASSLQHLPARRDALVLRLNYRYFLLMHSSNPRWFKGHAGEWR